MKLATYVRKLKDRSGNYIVPATRSIGVYLNDNQTLQSWIDTMEEDKFDLLTVYPVGAIFQSTSSTSPASLFGGDWEKIEARFLLGSGGGYGVSTTGGEANHVLSINEMPSHNHGWVDLQGNIYGGDCTAGIENMYFDGIFSAANFGNSNQQIKRGDPRGNAPEDIHINASHQHNWEGSGWGHNNMPPYYAVNIWRRTA